MHCNCTPFDYSFTPQINARFIRIINDSNWNLLGGTMHLEEEVPNNLISHGSRELGNIPQGTEVILNDLPDDTNALTFLLRFQTTDVGGVLVCNRGLRPFQPVVSLDALKIESTCRNPQRLRRERERPYDPQLLR